MSLNYELGRIKNWESVCKDEEGCITPETEGLIWATLVDMGAITEKNHKKFANRIKAYEHIYGGDHLVPRRKDDSIEAVVERHIGLSTNVTTKHASTFKKKLARIMMERIPYEIRASL